jgi:hypothetical protein
VQQVQNEDPTHEQLQLFNKLWNISFAHDSILVFSTGRSPALFHQLWVSRRVPNLLSGQTHRPALHPPHKHMLSTHRPLCSIAASPNPHRLCVAVS